MVICAKKNRSPRKTIDFHHSTAILLEKVIILSLLFIRPAIVRREQCLILGMVMTVFHFTLMIVIIQLSSPHGADTTIVPICFFGQTLSMTASFR